MAERAAAHEDRNLARMLTPAERRQAAVPAALRPQAGAACGDSHLRGRLFEAARVLIQEQACCTAYGGGDEEKACVMPLCAALAAVPAGLTSPLHLRHSGAGRRS